MVINMKMNKLALASALALSVSSLSSAMAQTPYYVDSMVCEGTQVGATNAQVSPGNNYEVLKFTSYATATKHGGLVSSLQVNEVSGADTSLFANQDQKAMAILNDKAQSNPEYGGPFSVDAQGNVKTSYANYNFKIQSSTSENGYRVDTLTGDDGDTTNLYGYGYYTLSCKAYVFSGPRNLIDQTNACRSAVGDAVVTYLATHYGTNHLQCKTGSEVIYVNGQATTQYHAFARCNNYEGYHFTVQTTPSDAANCSVEQSGVSYTGAENIKKLYN
jgi:hypothetical protein